MNSRRLIYLLVVVLLYGCLSADTVAGGGSRVFPSKDESHLALLAPVDDRASSELPAYQLEVFKRITSDSVGNLSPRYEKIYSTEFSAIGISPSALVSNDGNHVVLINGHLLEGASTPALVSLAPNDNKKKNEWSLANLLSSSGELESVPASTNGYLWLLGAEISEKGVMSVEIWLGGEQLSPSALQVYIDLNSNMIVKRKHFTIKSTN